MVRFLFSILTIAIISYLVTSFFPWWTLSVISFMVAIIFSLKSGKAFLSGFLGVSVLWLFVALKQDFANEHILSSRMAELFHLPNAYFFIIVAALIGGVVGGLSAWCGAIFRKNFI